MKEKIELNYEAIQLRSEFGVDANSPIDIFSLVHSNDDLTLVFYPMNRNVSGICIREGNNRIIGVNSESTYGRQRFTIAHELYHLYFHEEYDKIVCHTDLNIEKDDKEKEADIFASYFLIPYQALSFFIRENVKGRELELSDIIKIEQHFGVSRDAILWRLVNDKYITYAKSNKMRKNIIASAIRLGYDDKLYTKSRQSQMYGTYGKYIKLVEELKSKDLISNGKYEELLLSAFRSDIVYGTESIEDEIYD